MDRELAGMNRKKSSIEADDEGDEYSVELTYFNEISNIREDLGAYYSDLFDTTFAVAIAKLTVQIAEIKRNDAETSYERTEELFQAGRVPEYDVEEKRIALLESENELYQAESQAEDLLKYYRHITGMEWNEELFTELDFIRWRPQKEVWLQNDLDHRKAESSLKYAQHTINVLPENAPPFERRKAELQLENARLRLEAAEFNAQPNYEKAIRDITAQEKRITVLRERLNLERKKLEAAKVRFDESMISEEQYTRQKIAHMSAEKSYLEGWRQYMLLIVGVIVTVGERPAEVFR